MNVAQPRLPRSDALPFIGVFAAALFGAALAVSGAGDLSTAMTLFPWDILAIYVALEMFTSLLVATGVMDRLAVRLAALSRGRRGGVIIAFGVLLFGIGGFVNNLTDVLMVLPVSLVLLRSMHLDQRYVNAFFAMILAISNVAGASTPIGDFPAILIIGSEITTFRAYLTHAFPLFAVTAIALLLVYRLVARPKSGTPDDPIARQAALRLLEARYRHVRVERRALFRLLVVFAGMFVTWVLFPAEQVPVETVAWAGLSLAVLAVAPLAGRTGLQTFDLKPVLNIAAFLFVASMATTTGVMDSVASLLQDTITNPRVLLLALMVITTLLCAIFSAGPTAAAMLPVLMALTGPEAALQGHTDVVAVAFAAAICAGSSTFLTSATAGLMLSAKVTEAGLWDSEGKRLGWGFVSYLPYGLMNSGLQLAIAFAWAMLAISW